MKFEIEIQEILKKADDKKLELRNMSRTDAAVFVARAMPTVPTPLLSDMARDDLVNLTSMDALKKWLDPGSFAFRLYGQYLVKLSRALVELPPDPVK